MARAQSYLCFSDQEFRDKTLSVKWSMETHLPGLCAQKPWLGKLKYDGYKQHLTSIDTALRLLEDPL